jgi:hypothetical protein
MTKEKTEIAEAKTTAVGMPAEFAQFAGAGAENIAREDIKMPYLTIAESGTDYVKPGTDSYIEDAKIGDIINTSTKEVYSLKSGGATIIPVISKKVFTEWKPNRGGFVAHKETAEGAREVEIPMESGNTRKVLRTPEGNDLIETQYYLTLLVEADFSATPVMIAMSSTRLASARDMNTCIFNYTQKGMPSFAALLKLSTVLKKKDSYTWNIFSVAKLKEHPLLKDGFLDIGGNPKARSLFDMAVNLYKIATMDKGYFLNVASSEVTKEPVQETQKASERVL